MCTSFLRRPRRNGSILQHFRSQHRAWFASTWPSTTSLRFHQLAETQNIMLVAFLLCRKKSSKKTTVVEVVAVKHPESERQGALCGGSKKPIYDVENGKGHSAAATTTAVTDCSFRLYQKG
ncbi:resistance protein [Sesbania bispinosa]|nr:resistance protein [Sesbania bispinosa]